MRELRVIIAIILAATSGCTSTLNRNNQLDAVRQWMQEARERLNELPRDKQVEVQSAMAQLERSLERFETLVRLSPNPKEASSFAQAAAAIVAVRAPHTTAAMVATGLSLTVLSIVIRLRTDLPPPPVDLAGAWDDVVANLERVSQALLAAAPAMERPPDNDCTANLGLCLGTRLSRIPGGTHGRSLCWDCWEICLKEGWPDVDRNGRDCRWWLHP